MTEDEKNARIFKAFCDSNRLKILGLLQSGEKCACKLLEELNIGQPTLSHHMKVLCDAEIVASKENGRIIPLIRKALIMQKNCLIKLQR